MPHIYKSKTSSRNSSQKSTASSQGKASVKVDEDDFGNILMKIKPVSSKKSTPKTTTPSPRPEFLEPLSPAPVVSAPPPPPPPSPWDLLGMTEADFNAMQERVWKQYRADARKTYIDNLVAELDSPSYWTRRIERLETEREYFNKKRGWSALDIACVEQIDADIQECEDEIERIHAEMDRLEYEYD